MEDGDPEVLLKRARREKGKGKGKGKAALGTLEKDSGCGPWMAKTLKSVDFFGEDITAEEACLVDAAIASSLVTS